MDRLPRILLREADFGTDFSVIRHIRVTVFVDEQAVPPGLEFDERDAECPVGTARIDLEQGGKIGRVAVLREYRGRGVGHELMRRCHRLATQHGLSQVWCNAQTSAQPFYERIGYRAEGERFFEAGIEHVRMRRAV